MRALFALALCLAVMASSVAIAQEPKLAPVAAPEAPAIGHHFQPDPSGGFSRTVFETDEDPDFKITIRDFSFPPDKQTHTLTLPSAAFIHLSSGTGNISVAKKQVDLGSVARMAVPADAPIDVVNDTEYPLVIRALIIEGK